MDHLKRNAGKYGTGAVLVVIAGAAKLGYLPQPVADWLASLLPALAP